MDRLIDRWTDPSIDRSSWSSGLICICNFSGGGSLVHEVTVSYCGRNQKGQFCVLNVEFKVVAEGLSSTVFRKRVSDSKL